MECTIGGTRRHITDLSDGLLDRGVDLHLVVSAERQPDFRDDLSRLAERGAVVHEIPMLRAISPGRDVRQLLQISKLLRRVRPQFVHTHSSKAGVLGRIASESTGIGMRVHTPHTFAFLFEDLFGPAKRRLFFELERRLASGCAALVAVSEDEAEGFRRSGIVDAERIRVIENGIDPRPWSDADPVDVRAFGFDPARPLLLCAGLLYAAKGQDLLLEALAKPENAAWQCAFAGSGDDAHALAARANLLGLEDRVQWLGFRRDLPAWMAACDALALPSRWEGMPYVVLEAFAAGKPVVATPVAGARALVRADCGWLAASIDSEALAAALAACGSAGSEGRATRGARAQELVRADYGLERMIDRHVDLYRSVA
ncbi:MAG: glycosyltransferase [Planctomycetes bacterium]|nr:glycosyltransferase [Planctomycetota bacterium]